MKTKTRTFWLGLFTVGLCCGIIESGCHNTGTQDQDYGNNPFLESTGSGKEDTGYVNIRGAEVHVTLEAEVEASQWRIFDAPADLAQYAVTYLRKKKGFYLEILAEDTTTPERTEWLVGEQWLSKEQVEAQGIDKSQLRRFRIQEANAVLLDYRADDVEEGKVYEATVPLRPYDVMSDADDSCADYNSHIDLSQSVYWYLWNPDKYSCELDTQTMTLTVTDVLPRNEESYPEYDKLWADNKLEVVVVFGKLDDGDVADDYNWANVEKLGEWLTEADFEQAADAPLGNRYVKISGDKSIVVDIYGPDLFHSVADYSRLDNWQTAVREHEVVMYNGHSVLGSGMAFERADYPDHYQIFQVGSCLSYEYYVRPILEGKGDWSAVDVISNVEPTYYSENLPLTSTMLAKLIWGFEHEGRASWQDIMEAVSRRLGHSRFGVSGARGNCYSPEGDRCEPEPEPDPDTVRYENTDQTAIPDDDPDGIVSTIEVSDSASIHDLVVELDITHTYTGDLEIVLEHGQTKVVVWDREGGADDNIDGTFTLEEFAGLDSAGTWTLRVIDHAGWDTGTLDHWAIEVTAAQ